LLLQWLARFTLAMNEKQARQSTEGLVELSKASLHLYQELADEFPEIDFHKKGLLMIAQSAAGEEAALQELEYVGRYGVSGRALTPEEIRAMEPSVTGPLKGGVYFPNEAHAEPLKIVQALAQKAKALGVDIQEGVRVSSFQTAGSQVRCLRTNLGDRSASVYVMATGSWSTELAREIRIGVPILGGKGYAMILPKLEKQPIHPLMLVEKKVAVTPRQDSIRLAGTLELVNQDFSITERRVQAILRGAREFLQVPDQPEIREVWRGLRPCTPDGVPLIGFSKRVSNLALACGHQMLGLQSGFGTGKLLAELITDGRSDLDRAIFNPDRF
jgi:D-amino-acid dehydrogenase